MQLESYVLARKPLSEGSVAQNVLKWGTGGINIDGSRIGTETMINNPAGDNKLYNSTWKGVKKEATISEGRFPANIILDEAAAKVMDTKSGKVGNGWKKNYGAEDYKGNQYDSSTNQCKFGGGYSGTNTYTDEGGA